MAEGFWDLPLMVTLQGWVDASRAAIDPLHLIAGVLIAGLLLVWWLNKPPSARDQAPPGGHYMGNISPKKLPGMLQLPERKARRKSRSEMAEAIRKAADARRAEERGEPVVLRRKPEDEADEIDDDDIPPVWRD
jgi:hypothetical protein